MIIGYGENGEKVAMKGSCHGREEENELEEFLDKERGWILRSLGSCVNDARRGEYCSTRGLKRSRSWPPSRWLVLLKYIYIVILTNMARE